MALIDWIVVGLVLLISIVGLVILGAWALFRSIDKDDWP